MSPRDNQFDDWLDKKLSNEQSEQFENDVNNEQSMKEQIATAKYVEYLVDQEHTRKVPDWDRSAGIEFEDKRWWQWQGLPVLSMGFSCFAMVLVLFNVQLAVNDDGVLLIFGQQNSSQQQVAKLVDEKLNAYQQQQQLALANFTADLSAKQQESNLQLAGYILDTSRQERKEDISDFIQFVNAQRQDDVVEQRIRYQRLEDAIQYQGQFINNTSIQPASWVSEE
ncbi:hypothetical protein HII17_05460 [Thalassotalea sp. M1531]|uniref:Uncharacterized protein n=1 Tax=Thalassotalea algicola TaxID=2716224 RepID=A0A7Y0Q6M7_9GAMM|nr:hypothetical protein [Thalassotalea algicola]NMP31007.1 hypothetical protein [Thalassotalea algicola]